MHFFDYSYGFQTVSITNSAYITLHYMWCLDIMYSCMHIYYVLYMYVYCLMLHIRTY